MADSPDQVLQILIKLGVVGQQDVQAAKQLIAETKDGTKELGGNLRDAAGETTGFTKETTKLTDATQGLNVKKRELLESMRLVTAQFPLLGEAARTFFNPTTAALFVIIGAFELWRDRVDGMADSLGELNLDDLSDGLRQAGDAADAASGGWSDLAKAVTDADTAFNSVEETQKRTLQSINDQLAAQQKLLAAQKQLAEAKLDQQRVTGAITPEQYDAQKSAIEQGYNDRTIHLEINARNAELAEKKKAASDMQGEANSYAKQANDLTKKYGIGETDEEFQAIKKARQEVADAMQKEIDDARKQLALLNEADSDDTSPGTSVADWAKLIGHYGAGVTTPGGFAQAYSTEQARINKNEADQKQVEQQMAELDRVKKERDAFKKKADESQGKAETDRQSLQGQDDPNKVGSVAWQNAQDAARMKIQDQTSQVQRDAQMQKQFLQDADFIQKVDTSKNVTPDTARAAAQKIKEMADMIQGHRELLQQIANLPLGLIIQEMANVQAKIAALSGQIKVMATRQ